MYGVWEKMSCGDGQGMKRVVTLNSDIVDDGVRFVDNIGWTIGSIAIMESYGCDSGYSWITDEFIDGVVGDKYRFRVSEDVYIENGSVVLIGNNYVMYDTVDWMRTREILLGIGGGQKKHIVIEWNNFGSVFIDLEYILNKSKDENFYGIEFQNHKTNIWIFKETELDDLKHFDFSDIQIVRLNLILNSSMIKGG